MTFVTPKNILMLCSIAISITIQANSITVPLEKLTLGDTVDKINLNKTSAVVYGNIINFHDETPSFVKSLTESVNNHPTWSAIEYSCSKSLSSLFNDPVDVTNSPINLFNVFDKQKLNHESFGIDKKYLNNKYTCMLFELCQFEKQKYKDFVHLFDEKLFSKNKDDYYYYNDNRRGIKHFDILKFRIRNETHYISSINNGDCLFQIFVFNTEPEDISIDYNEKIPEYKSKILMASNNNTLETNVMSYLNNYNISLCKFTSHPLQVKSNIISYLRNENVLSIELTVLPKLPRSLNSKEGDGKLLATDSKWTQMKPGDTFNIRDIKSDSILINGNILNFLVFDKFDYRNFNDNYQITNNSYINSNYRSQCRESIVKYYNYDSKKNVEKLTPFDCYLQEEFYGIDSKFLNENYKRVEVKICRIIEEEKIKIDPFEIVYLDEKFIDFEYNVFDNENVVIQFPKGNETHYISSIQFGDCLYQALVYKLNGKFTEKPIHAGKILSASKDSKLEEWVKTNLMDNNLNQIYSNQTIKDEVIEKLGNRVLLNLNLRSLREKRSPPYLEFIQFHNFTNLSHDLPTKILKNSSQDLPTILSKNSSQNLPTETPDKLDPNFSSSLKSSLFNILLLLTIMTLLLV
ncbi:uncharacterized protein LOC130673557 [Microplitis mediator]|uniref:uncharacterized protein LOC130673557 n=1 Tax=Microplitis mediator TaxID=375433 RepID=UPI002555AD22|nr:uncharacterized protein LOC130673557 [Microplitis mediator]